MQGSGELLEVSEAAEGYRTNAGRRRYVVGSVQPAPSVLVVWMEADSCGRVQRILKKKLRPILRRLLKQNESCLLKSGIDLHRGHITKGGFGSHWRRCLHVLLLQALGKRL